MKFLLAWSVALAACALAPAQAQEFESEAQRQGEFITVQASVDLPVDRRTVWGVVTDYDRLAEFIPDMEYSRVVSRNPPGVVVRQKGEFGILFFSRVVEIELAVVESPPHAVVSRLISGNLRDLSGRYDLEERGEGTRLVYRGRLLPEYDLPPLIGLAMVRHSLNRHFGAMVREILRRDDLAKAQARSGAPGSFPTSDARKAKN
jgi:carbon monoxide dehydrogenase subunit G